MSSKGDIRDLPVGRLSAPPAVKGFIRLMGKTLTLEKKPSEMRGGQLSEVIRNRGSTVPVLIKICKSYSSNQHYSNNVYIIHTSTSMSHRTKVGLLLVQCLQHWPSNKPTLIECLMLAETDRVYLLMQKSPLQSCRLYYTRLEASSEWYSLYVAVWVVVCVLQVLSYHIQNLMTYKNSALA